MVTGNGVGMSVGAMAVAYAVAAALPTVLAGYALWYHRESPTARAFAAFMGALVVWTGAYLCRLFAPPRLQFGLTVVAFAGVAWTPVALLAFALRYTDREQFVTPVTVALLSVVPVATVAVLATTATHGLFYDSMRVIEVGGLRTVVGDYGAWFWVHTAYSYGLLAVASALLVGFGLTRRRLYRTQAALLVLGVVVAWVTNAVFLSGLSPLPAFDLTPVGLAAGSVLLALAVFRARLVDVTPVARDAVVAAMDDAVVVVEGDRVVDVNRAAEALLGADRVVGRLAGDVLPDPLLDVLEADGGAVAGDQRVVDMICDGERRWYKVRTIPLGGGSRTPPAVGGADTATAVDGADGQAADGTATPDDGGAADPPSTAADTDGPPATVLLLTDITAQKHHLRRLRKQNEQLEEFATAAAHDLRNPLNVIDGYLELAHETGEERHFERVADATDRMHGLVEDLLALGRRGRLVEATQPVDLGEAAERAWRNIDAPEAELSVVPGDPVPADEDRLVQLLENLFANAVQQADGPITVTVGRTPDGFYVADDGPGIPAADRDRVFEYGYTTREAGSGFGLAIVETVADAHGWDVEVGASESGGARFDVTGVTDAERTRLEVETGAGAD